MDPVTRYQDALTEMRNAAAGLFVPEALPVVAPALATLARAGEVSLPALCLTPYRDEAPGDPLVP